MMGITSPRRLYIDDDAAIVTWGWLGTLPLSSETVLFLRNIGLDTDMYINDLDPRHLIFDKCVLNAVSANELLGRFHHLETLVLYKTDVEDYMRTLAKLPMTIRRVHVLQQDVYYNKYTYGASVVLPRLESFTFTWLLPPTDSGPQLLAGDNLDTFADLRRDVKSIANAPQCTFKFLRSTRSPEDALADALAALNLDL